MIGKIRIANIKDLIRITELLNSDKNLSFNHQVGEYDSIDVKEYITNKINKTLVYEENNKILGLIIAQFWKTYAYLHLIVVDKDHQGKGIGKLLINYLEELAMKKGIDCIEGITEIDNQPMQGLFEKSEFKKVCSFYGYSKDLKSDQNK